MSSTRRARRSRRPSRASPTRPRPTARSPMARNPRQSPTRPRQTKRPAPAIRAASRSRRSPRDDNVAPARLLEGAVLVRAIPPQEAQRDPPGVATAVHLELALGGHLLADDAPRSGVLDERQRRLAQHEVGELHPAIAQM